MLVFLLGGEYGGTRLSVLVPGLANRMTTQLLAYVQRSYLVSDVKMIMVREKKSGTDFQGRHSGKKPKYVGREQERGAISYTDLKS